MITWPIFLALIFAYIAVRSVIRMEEKKEEEELEKEKKTEEESKE